MRKQVILILGPTAVGKTELSIRLAQKFSGEIVSLDSRLLYRGMDIGTAKPTAVELATVPHHLIDVAELGDPWSLVDVLDAARAEVEGILRRNSLPFLVGGTGQYVYAFLEGWTPPSGEQDPALRERLEAVAENLGSEVLHEMLMEVDPIRAEEIDARNVRRVIRALEIFNVTGIPPSQQRIKQPPPYDILRIGIFRPRTELYERIDQRIERMIEQGWEAEVRSLIEVEELEKSPAMSAIGYREITSYIRGEISLIEAAAEIKKQNRKLVRRQANWFKIDDPLIHWFEASTDPVSDISRLIENWLET